MPSIAGNKLGVALDMHGCPNRCRHCWLGSGTNRPLADDDLRWMAAQFRRYVTRSDTPIESLAVTSWFREPDFSDAYQRLHELEEELSDGKPERYELLSIWRLARDRAYASWAKKVGPDTCQISFFGMKETTDWFHRRPGAFEDALSATERLLHVGMKPRWQIFLTAKLIPELADLLHLIDDLRLRERVRELGGEFQVFMHPPGPSGAGRGVENLLPTADEVASLPEDILAASRQHLGRQVLWRPEKEWHAQIMMEDHPPSVGEVMPETLWLQVTNKWDVYSNLGTLESWWRLGNLKKDSVDALLGRFEQDEVFGLDVLLHRPPRDLAREFGDPDSGRIYSSQSDLLALYRAKYCGKVVRRGMGTCAG